MTVEESPGDRSVRDLRIVFALYYYHPYSSGLTMYVRRLAEELARRGALVTVVAARHDPTSPSRELVNGVHVVRARVWLRFGKGVVAPGITATVARLSRRAEAVMPVMPLAEAGLIASLVPGRKLLPIYVCDLNLGPGRLKSTLVWIAGVGARWALRRAPQHIVLSLEYARSSGIAKAHMERAVAVSPPVDTHVYAPRPTRALRERLGIGANPVVGFVGRLVYEKGIPVLIKAMREVRRTHPDALLVIAGEGRSVAGGGILDEVHNAIRDDPGVLVTGFLTHEDLLSFYSMCTVLALPSIDPLEAFGMVQVEAMLCGCPVVASDMPGVSIPVRESGMGVLARRGDAGDLAHAIGRVLDDPGAFLRSREEIARIFDPALSYEALVDAVNRTWS